MGCVASKPAVIESGIRDEDEEKKAEYDKMVELATKEKKQILEKKAQDEKYWEEVATENRNELWKWGSEEVKLQRRDSMSEGNIQESVKEASMDDETQQRILDCIYGAGSLVTFHPSKSSTSPSNLRSPNKLLYPGEFLGTGGAFGSLPVLSLELGKNSVSGVARDPVTKQALMAVIREPVVDMPSSISALLKRKKGPATLLHTNGALVGALYSQALPRSATQNCEWGAKAYALDVRRKPEPGDSEQSKDLIPLVVYEWWRGKGEPMLLGFFTRNRDGSRGDEIALYKTEHDAEETSWMNSSVLEVFDACPADPISIMIFAWFLFYTEVLAFAVAKPGVHYAGSPMVTTPFSNSSYSTSNFSSPVSLPTAPSSPPHLSLSPTSPLTHHVDEHRDRRYGQ